MTFKLLPFFAIFSLALFGFSASANAQSAAAHQDINVASFKKMMSAPNTVILDVRTPGEIAQGKINGAVALDFYAADFQQRIDKLDKSKTYLVVCRSGSRSGQACRMMQQKGFSKLYNLQGGMMAWGQQK
jgi:rhodanese-related sulfurtransferase